jgi:hypothetical protein
MSAMRVQATASEQHQPQRVIKFSGLQVIADRAAQTKPLRPELQTEILCDYLNAIEALTSGRGTGKHYDVLVYACDISKILTDNDIGNAYSDMVSPALAALHRCRTRYDESGKWGLDGDGLQPLREMVELHRAQLEITTRAELQAAIAEMHRRLKQTSKSALTKEVS